MVTALFLYETCHSACVSSRCSEATSSCSCTWCGGVGGVGGFGGQPGRTLGARVGGRRAAADLELLLLLLELALPGVNVHAVC
jgi:hypothetical protein